MIEKHKDTIYAEPVQAINNFEFDESVSHVFEDMIQRSVPGYLTIIKQISLLAEEFAQADSLCYDLGCSLGAASLSLAEGMSDNKSLKNCKIIAIDNSAAMISKAQNLVDLTPHKDRINFKCLDIENTSFENASIIVMNFTLQFIPIKKRQAIINKIYEGLLPRGLLILSEKIIFENPNLQQLNTELHHRFKQTNGYSELEIAQKRAALENTLYPETISDHQNRMLSAGFKSAEVWFQCFNFISMLAVKAD